MKLSDGEWSIASCPSSDVPSRLRNGDKLVSLIPARSQKASTAKPLPANPDRTCYHSSVLRRVLRLSLFVAIPALSSRVPMTALSTVQQGEGRRPRSCRLPLFGAAGPTCALNAGAWLRSFFLSSSCSCRGCLRSRSFWARLPPILLSGFPRPALRCGADRQSSQQ